MKRLAFKILPWVITALALYLAFEDIDWGEMNAHISEGNVFYLLLAIVLTALSYLLRSYRWIFFFPERKISFLDSFKVLIMGFFMNNILPLRAGELVRAHLGSKFTNRKRTLVLATIASERLADGLMLSLFFMFYILLSNQHLQSDNMFYLAALLFLVIAVLVMATLLFKEKVFAITNFLSNKANKSYIDYANDRLQTFINGLRPMFSLERLPILGGLTLLVWFVELSAYYVIVQAFNSDLNFLACIVFLVAVNFSSLFPSAPGGIGVIEAVGSAALVSIGVQKELALSMVITQHLIQILVIAVPGIILTIALRSHLNFKEYRSPSK